MTIQNDSTVDLRDDELHDARDSAVRPAADIRPEDPKRNPVTYAALVLSVLALLLSAYALSRDVGPEKVQVGDKVCIVDRLEGAKTDTLFCQQ